MSEGALQTASDGGAAPMRASAAIYARYLPLVRRIAMRTGRRLPREVTIDDVLGAGWLGLVEALKRRGDSMSEEEFEAYASHRVRGAILDYLRSLDPMSRRMRAASRSISGAIAQVTARVGRAPEEEEIAGELGIEIEVYRTLLGQVAEADMNRLEITDALGAKDSDAPDFIAGRRELATLIADAVTTLPERLQLVVALYYQDECSLREIGEVLGVTESRACQLHTEAIHRIRAAIEPGQPPTPSMTAFVAAKREQ